MKKAILAINFSLAIIGCNFSIAKNIQAEKKSDSPSNQETSWAGCYKQKSYLCTSPKDGSNCEDQFSDTLKITPKGSIYIAQLHSTQANQNICAFEFEMTDLHGSLIHETEFGKVSIIRQRESIYISSKGIDPTALGLGICGIHADINELTFKISNKSTDDSDCANTEGGELQ